MNTKHTKFYAVAKGRTSGIYNTWGECQEQTYAYPDARFKKFNTIEDAERFIEYFSVPNPQIPKYTELPIEEDAP